MATNPKPDVNPRTNPKAAGPPAPLPPKKATKKKPPIVVVTKGAPTHAAKGSAWVQFVNYWAAHGYKAFKQNSQAILLAAKAEHIDPITFGALVLNETGGHFKGPDSSAGAIGIGQLLPSSFVGPNAWNGGVLPWAKNHHITVADLRNPAINLRLSAAYFGWLQGQFPSDPYGRYNAGPNADPTYTGKIQKAFMGKWVYTWNPKYVSTTATTAPPTPAGAQVPGGQAAQKPDIPFKNPYVSGVLPGSGKKGGIDQRFATTTDPNKALKFNGNPLTVTSFKSIQDSLTSIYVSYTGGRPSLTQTQDYIQHGWSSYTLSVLLSHNKNFTKSPIYKQFSVNWKDDPTIKNALAGGKLPPELIRQGIVNHWDANTILTKARALPSYIVTNEFRGNVATMLNTHSAIMGTPTAKDLVQIKDAALQGWSTDQYAAYVRSQPAYKTSPEYQSRALQILSALGMITGHMAVLSNGINVGPGPGAVGPNVGPGPKTDPRVKQAVPPDYPPPPAPVPKLGVTFSGL